MGLLRFVGRSVLTLIIIFLILIVLLLMLIFSRILQMGWLTADVLR